MAEIQDDILKNKVIELEKEIQNQQQEMKKTRKSICFICIVLALCQAASGYVHYVQRKVGLALVESNARNKQTDLLETQINLVESKELYKVICFLLKDAKFRNFLQEDPDFLDSIQEDLKEAQGMLEDIE